MPHTGLGKAHHPGNCEVRSLGPNCFQRPGKAKETSTAHQTLPARQHWVGGSKCGPLSRRQCGVGPLGSLLGARGQRSWFGEPTLLSRAAGLLGRPGPGASWPSNLVSSAAVLLSVGLCRCSWGQAGEEVMRRQGTSRRAPGLAWHQGCGGSAQWVLSSALWEKLTQPMSWVAPMISITSPRWQLPAPHLHLHLDVSESTCPSRTPVFCQSHPCSAKGTPSCQSPEQTLGDIPNSRMSLSCNEITKVCHFCFL